MENTKIQKSKWDILGNFQTLCLGQKKRCFASNAMMSLKAESGNFQGMSQSKTVYIIWRQSFWMQALSVQKCKKRTVNFLEFLRFWWWAHYWCAIQFWHWWQSYIHEIIKVVLELLPTFLDDRRQFPFSNYHFFCYSSLILKSNGMKMQTHRRHFRGVCVEIRLKS